MSDAQKIRAVETLNRWLAGHGAPNVQTGPADWNINPFADALLLTPAGRRRSNRAYFVRGDEVYAFSPSVTSFGQGYEQLGRPDGTAPTP